MFVLAAAVAAPSPANDVCLAMIPPRLTAQLIKEHPEYTLPFLTDGKPDRLLAAADAGGWPCPFVAIADVDGDGALDRALVLKHKSQPVTRFLVARNVDGMWRSELQRDWPLSIDATVVEPLEAGLYEQTRAGPNAAAQLDNLNSIQSDHPGFVAGQFEGAKAAYFFVNAKWQQIWIKD